MAFLEGRLCLGENPPWLNELIAVPGKGYCVVYPLTPALLMLPLVIIHSVYLTQTTLAHLIFAWTAVVIYLYWKKQKMMSPQAITLSLIWSFATIFLSLSAVGSAWYIAQTIGSFFLWMSLLVFNPNSKKSIFFTGLLLSLAANARLPLHLYIFYFVFLFFAHRPIKIKSCLFSIVILGLGFLPMFLGQRAYNYVRYQTIADEGYYLIPGKFDEDDFRSGQFNLINIPKHLKVLFFKMPKRVETFPYFVPSYYGLTVLLTSPFLLAGIWHLLQKRQFAALGTIGTIMLLEMSHGTVGFVQFGYRFALDIYPLLFVGFGHLWIQKRVRLSLLPLVILSVLVNLWGLLAFRFDWFIW